MGTYRITSLEDLRSDMIARDRKVTCFNYVEASWKLTRNFSVVFSVKPAQNTLLFAQRLTSLGFLISLDDDLNTTPWLDAKTYGTFCSIFELSGSDKMTFKPRHFLENFTASGMVPKDGRGALTSCRGISIRLSKLADGNEFFDHFVCHKIRKPSQENLGKTRMAFGDAIAEFCGDRNVSTNWVLKAPSFQAPRHCRNLPDLVPFP